MGELMKGKGFELGPGTDDISEAMFLNRSLETNWMLHRLLPYMRNYGLARLDLPASPATFAAPFSRARASRRNFFMSS